MNILLVLPSLAVGGAEVFAVRLANQLAGRGHCTFLLHFDPTRCDPVLEERVKENVRVITFKHRLSAKQKLWWKLMYWITRWNSSLYKKVQYRRDKLKAKVFSEFIENFCQQENIEVINSHLQYADWLVAHYFWKKSRHQKFVISMHGCYNRSKYPVNSALRNLNVDTRRVMEAADRIVLLTSKNVQPLRGFTLKNDPMYIPLGFELLSRNESEHDSTWKHSTTFGLVSRAAVRKGWEEAIQAVKLLQQSGNNCRLILVGDGECLLPLQAAYNDLSFIHFIGATAHVLDWVHQFDVGLFPSYIESESYPNTVIEYLACGKPVIGTDIGEVRNMISTSDKSLAGQLLTYIPEGISVQELATCMLRYVEDHRLLARHSEMAFEAFKKFDMDRCLDAYETAYQ